MLLAVVYRALLFPPSFFGIPKKIFMLFMCVTLMMVLSYRQYWFIAVAVIVFFSLAKVGQKDPFAIDTILDLIRRLPNGVYGQ